VHDRPFDGHKLTSHDVARIAAAFELTGDLVLADAALVSVWLNGEPALLALLRARHHWDASMAPYYVIWLRGN
jgi:hypothetical protein